MINNLPTITGATPINTVKSNYRSLVNDAGNASPVDQVFWNFLTDAESPVSLTSTQLDAISQAMTSIDPADSTLGDAFCGQLTSLNQVLRSTITDAEADAIMREIQQNAVAYKNVASLMEVMNVLEDGTALANAGATFTSPKTVPTPQDALEAAYAGWLPDRTGLYTVASIDPDTSVAASGFDATDVNSNFYNIIVNAVTAGSDPGTFESPNDESTFRASLVQLLMTDSAALTTAQTNAQVCVDNANGAPQIYQDWLFLLFTQILSGLDSKEALLEG